MYIIYYINEQDINYCHYDFLVVNNMSLGIMLGIYMLLVE